MTVTIAFSISALEAEALWLTPHLKPTGLSTAEITSYVNEARTNHVRLVDQLTRAGLVPASAARTLSLIQKGYATVSVATRFARVVGAEGARFFAPAAAAIVAVADTTAAAFFAATAFVTAVATSVNVVVNAEFVVATSTALKRPHHHVC